MIRILLIVAFLLVSVSQAAQAQNTEQVQVSASHSMGPLSKTYDGFADDFKKSAASPFNESDLAQIFQDYSGLILTGVDTNQLVNAIQGKKTSYFPLEKLRGEPFYCTTMNILMHSKNPNQRIMAYITACFIGRQFIQRRYA